MSKKQLGKNAQLFSDHICAGLEAGGLDLEDYVMSIITDQETGEMGFLMSQVPMSEMCEEHPHQPIVCWEDHVSWPSEEDAAHLAISEQQPASKCAVLFLGAMLTGGTMATPKCPECEE